MLIHAVVDVMFYLSIFLYILGLSLSAKNIKQTIQDLWYNKACQLESHSKDLIVRGAISIHDAVYRHKGKISLKKMALIVMLFNATLFIGLLIESSGKEVSYEQFIFVCSFYFSGAFFYELISYFFTRRLLDKYATTGRNIYLVACIPMLVVITILPLVISTILQVFVFEPVNIYDEYETMSLRDIIVFSFLGNIIPHFFFAIAIARQKYLVAPLFFLTSLSMAFPIILWITTKILLSTKFSLKITTLLIEKLDGAKAEYLRNIGLILFTFATGLMSYIQF